MGTYLWKNRGMQRNADQVFVILGASLLAIAWGAKSDTFVDNVGKRLQNSASSSLALYTMHAGAGQVSEGALLESCCGQYPLQ